MLPSRAKPRLEYEGRVLGGKMRLLAEIAGMISAVVTLQVLSQGASRCKPLSCERIWRKVMGSMSSVGVASGGRGLKDG